MKDRLGAMVNEKNKITEEGADVCKMLEEISVSSIQNNHFPLNPSHGCHNFEFSNL